MRFYVSLFKNSKVVNVSNLPGGIVTGSFELDGQLFMALQGGSEFKLNESFSMYVDCADQEEVDRLWDALTADGGEESMCGWLKDRYGLSWQIIPKALGELMGDPDPEKAGRVMQAMLKMHKIEVAQLQKAYQGN